LVLFLIRIILPDPDPVHTDAMRHISLCCDQHVFTCYLENFWAFGQ